MALISILRNEESLTALYWLHFDSPTVPKPGVEEPRLRPSAMILSDPLEEVIRMDADDATRTKRLLSAWSRLQAVRELNERVLADVLIVLLETRPAPSRDKVNLPPLDPDADRRVFRPTAANPRAYRGKRDRPPKPRLPSPYDLRPYLVTPEAQTSALRRLASFWPLAKPMLVREGYDESRLEKVDFSAEGHLDPYWDYYHGEMPCPSLPRTFSTHFLWMLRDQTSELIHRVLVSFRRLELSSPIRLQRAQSGL